MRGRQTIVGRRPTDPPLCPRPPPLQPDACKLIPAAVAPMITLTRAMLRELEGQASEGRGG